MDRRPHRIAEGIIEEFKEHLIGVPFAGGEAVDEQETLVRHETGIFGRNSLRRTVEADVNNRDSALLTGTDEAGDEMISGDAGINLPHKVIARDYPADGLIHLRYAGGRPVLNCHGSHVKAGPGSRQGTTPIRLLSIRKSTSLDGPASLRVTDPNKARDRTAYFCANSARCACDICLTFSRFMVSF